MCSVCWQQANEGGSASRALQCARRHGQTVVHAAHLGLTLARVYQAATRWKVSTSLSVCKGLDMWCRMRSSMSSGRSLICGNGAAHCLLNKIWWTECLQHCLLLATEGDHNYIHSTVPCSLAERVGCAQHMRRRADEVHCVGWWDVMLASDTTKLCAVKKMLQNPGSQHLS